MTRHARRHGTERRRGLSAVPRSAHGPKPSPPTFRRTSPRCRTESDHCVVTLMTEQLIRIRYKDNDLERSDKNPSASRLSAPRAISLGARSGVSTDKADGYHARIARTPSHHPPRAPGMTDHLNIPSNMPCDDRRRPATRTPTDRTELALDSRLGQYNTSLSRAHMHLHRHHQETSPLADNTPKCID